jgi:L-amino acid N-acyltransferase YncA
MVSLEGQNDHVGPGLLGLAVDFLTPAEWPQLRTVRLRALRESPSAFASSHELEATRSEHEWRATFVDGTWVVARTPHGIVGLARTTQADAGPAQRYVESVWVDPGFRQRGITRQLLDALIERERRMEVRELLLWVIDGNDTARRIYEHLEFRSTGERHLLNDRSGRFEERLALRLQTNH